MTQPEEQGMNEFPACIMVFWPGQPTAMCVEHAEKAVRIAGVMGSPPPPLMPIDGSQAAQCQNCIKEHKT
jgi:hypothetical protein